MNHAPTLEKPIRIIQITDFHLLSDTRLNMMGINTELSFLAVLDHAWRDHEGVALLLMTGDLVQDASVATYQRLRQRLEGFSVPCYCLPGNHDDPALIRQTLVGGNVHFEGQILLDGWQLICLDSTVPGDAGGYLTEGQLGILEAGLVGQPGRHALVCLHHSPLPTGADWLDTMKLSNADALFAQIDRFPQIKGVVFGHIHQAMDAKYKHVRLLGCPSTCYQFKPNSKDFALDNVPQGYRRLDLLPDGEIVTELVRLNSVPHGLDMDSNGY